MQAISPDHRLRATNKTDRVSWHSALSNNLEWSALRLTACTEVDDDDDDDYATDYQDLDSRP